MFIWNSPFTVLLIAMILSFAIGPSMVKMLMRLKAGQSIREDGPKSHMVKQGTPTMGGLIFIIPAVIALLATKNFTNNLVPILSMLGFGLIGFIDDFVKVVLKRNLGLTAKQKILGQLIVAAGVGYLAYATIGSTVIIPFIKTEVSIGWFYIPFSMFVMIATSNSANLTDGLDGLAASVTAIILIAFGFIAINYMNFPVLVFAIALLGGCLGFLRLNMHPARVFMGDTGSMALGGAVVGISMALKLEILIPIICFIYFLESVSVIIQVLYYKKTKKRFFRMAPIHHHFENENRSENKIVLMFCLVTAVMSVIGYFAARF